MKKISSLLIALLFLLTSCSPRSSLEKLSFFKDDAQISNDSFETIIKAIQNQDENLLKSLFSKKAIMEADDFEKSVTDLFDFYQGEMISYDDFGAQSINTGINDGEFGFIWKSIQSTYMVKTDEQIYRIAIKEFVQDTSDIDNVGIYSLYIIKEENSDPEFAYWGDGKWSPGIIIDS